MNDWLLEGENCRISLTARAVLEDIVRKNTSRELWESRPDKGEFNPFTGRVENAICYILRIRDPKASMSWVELHVTDTATDYEIAGSQVLRYLRYLDGIRGAAL